MSPAALASLAIIASCATSVSAENYFRLSFSLEQSDAPAWTPDISVTPGTTVFVRVEITIDATCYGLSSARFNVVSLPTGGWDVGGNDTVSLEPGNGNPRDGRMTGFDWLVQTNAVFESAGTLRIDGANDRDDLPAVGLNPSQQPPASLSFKKGTQGIPVYKFSVAVSPDAGFEREIQLAILTEQITSLKAYPTSTSTISDLVTPMEPPAIQAPSLSYPFLHPPHFPLHASRALQHCVVVADADPDPHSPEPRRSTRPRRVERGFRSKTRAHGGPPRVAANCFLNF